MTNLVIGRTRATLSLLRLRPFDTLGPQGRSRERHRLIALSALTSAAAKLISIGTAIISVPLTLHYLGSERFGMWITMSSFLVMLSFADLGIGNGLMTEVAAAYGRDRMQEIRNYVSSSLFVLIIITVIILSLFAVAYPYVPWFELFNVQSDLARREAAPSVAIIITCFGLSVPAGIVQRVQTGVQRGFMANAWQCVASTFGLIGVILAIRLEAGLHWLVLAFVGTPLIAALLNSLSFFGWSGRDYAPSLTAVSRDASMRVIHTGALFLGLQITSAVAFASNSIFVAQFLGAAEVTQYAVPERLFNFITLITAMIIAPLWPAYGEANARGDHAWVKRTLLRSLFIGVGFAALFASFLLAAGPLVIRLWVGDAIIPSFSLMLGFALWKIIEVGGSAVSMFQNGHDLVRFQLFTATLVAISVVPLKIVLLQSIGVSGAVWAMIISYLICSALPTFIAVRRWWKR